MKRREFIAGAAVLWPLAARAQQPDRVRRIGWLDIYAADDPAAQERVAAVRADLEKLGWIVGRNLQIDYRGRVLSAESAREAAAELLALKPDVILCAGSPGVKALEQATSTVPVVFVLVTEPVEQGIVSSLARPAGNVTGFAYLERTVGAKWLELLKEIAPQTKRVGYIFSPLAAPYAPLYHRSIEQAAAKLGVVVDKCPVTDPKEIEPILERLSPGGGAIFNADSFVNNNSRLETELAARYRVPAVYGSPATAEFGGLVNYSLDLMAHYLQAVPYLDRILRGANPGDLPVQQPTKFRFVINLKAAKAIGLTVPATLLARADEVIE